MPTTLSLGYFTTKFSADPEISEKLINDQIEPGGFSTDWAGPSAKFSKPSPAYSFIWEARKQNPVTAKRGDPHATRNPILKIVDTEKPPLRVFFGKTPLDTATKDYESRLATWKEWQPISIEAQGEE